MSVDNGWSQWKEHVLKELERFDENQQEMTEALYKCHIEIAKLQVKSGVWGLIGGMIPVMIYILISYAKN